MEQVVETLKQNEQQTRIEQEMIIENLNKEIESLRKRQEQTLNEQLKFLEEENKKLVKVRETLCKSEFVMFICQCKYIQILIHYPIV